MTKTYHFMAGLPRSGSTVLAALLNQHPDIYASPQTDLIRMLYDLDEKIPQYESYRAGLLHAGYQNVMNNMTNNFYSHISKPVIIDKNRAWGTPYNWTNLSPYVNPEGKVILTMRPILEVIASFVRVVTESEKVTNELRFLNKDFWVSEYRDPIDALVDSLMVCNGEIDRAIFSISNLIKNHSKNVHVVWYADLIHSPQKTLNEIYNFLGLKKIKNNFNNIVESDKHDDLLGYGVIGLHDIKKELAVAGTKPEDYLSEYVINKYKNALDFILQ